MSISSVDAVILMLSVLFIASSMLALERWLKLQFTLLLVLVGVVCKQFMPMLSPHFASYLTVNPDFILYICLPTLLFESASSIDGYQFKKNLGPIMMLAIPGVLVSTFITAVIVAGFTPMVIGTALLLGAILSATDPVAVIALFKQLGTPKRLTLLVEGESLFNDATAIVLSQIIVGLLLSGEYKHMLLLSGVWVFAVKFFMGVFIGWLLALTFGFILGLVENNPLIEISISTVLAYGSFFIAEHVFHVSGVIATVTAGILMGGWGRTKISHEVEKYLHSYWSFLAYIMNSLIFLMVGFSLNFAGMKGHIGMLAVLIVAMTIARAVVIYTLIPLVNMFTKTMKVSKGYQAVIFWGGMRGAIALALALSLENIPGSDLIVDLIAGVVIFTLVVQGLSIEKVIQYFGIDKPSKSSEFVRLEGELAAVQYALNELPNLQEGGTMSARLLGSVNEMWNKSLDFSKEQLATFRDDLDPAVEQRMLLLRCLANQKQSFYTMYVKGHVSESSYLEANNVMILAMDTVRTTDVIKLPDVKKLFSSSRSQFWANLFERVPGLNFIASMLRQQTIGSHYELLWMWSQSCLTVIEFIEQLNKQGFERLANIKAMYERSKLIAKSELDQITAYFPEFVNAMQERMAQRVFLHAEYESILHQEERGLIPPDLAETMKANVDKQLLQLKEKHPQKISTDPTELLKKVPMLQNMPCEELIPLLHERLAAGGEVIFEENASGESMYLILRGVVRVSKEVNGRKKDIATLTAGDYFGEIALVEHVKRTATCTAATPCSLYELYRHDFEKILAKYPSIKAEIEETVKKRT